jgi:inward rectifier potassium channel
MLVTAEAFTGLLAQALITGLLFARFARPTMALRYTSLSSRLTRMVARSCFARRNKRRNELIEMEAKVSFSILDEDAAGAKRRFHPLALERRSVNFLPLSWTLVHPITPESPLWGLTAADFERRDAEILVLMQGTDDTFATRVSSRRSYRGEDIVWGAKFASVFTATRADGRVGMDMARLDQYESVELPDDRRA